MLESVLEHARELGFVGPGPVVDHINHASAFAEAIGASPSGRALDLGSGAGLPGLALAQLWPDSHWVLLDAGARRCEFLEQSVATLGLGKRVHVLRALAEELGREGAHRGAYRLVTARSFGPPATTAECAAPFLVRGGSLVVSEPPNPPPDRWPPDPLRALGLTVTLSRRAGEANFQVLEQTELCPERFPRRQGRPRTRPLFD